MPAIPEENVLEPRAPLLDNPDDWLTFSLQKVRVISQKTGDVVSLLSAHQENPVTVIGKLDEVNEDELHLVRHAEYKGKTIAIGDVKTYAFAEYNDSTYGFWAAGKAGWYEIESSAPSYRQVLEQMNEATSILYALADRLRHESKAKTRPSPAVVEKFMRQMCTDYLGQSRDPTKFTDIDDVRDAIHEHRVFLITSMLEGQEAIDWTNSPILTYLTQHFPADIQTIRSRLPATTNRKAPEPLPSTIPTLPEPPKTADIPSKAVRKRKSASPPNIAIAAKPKKRRGRPPKNAQAPQKRKPMSVFDDDDEDDDGEIDSGAPVDGLNKVTRKQRSILRPPGTKSAKKTRNQPGRKRTRPGFAEPEESDSSSEDEKGRPQSIPITMLKDAEHLESLTNPPRKSTAKYFSLDPLQVSGPKFLPRKYLEMNIKTYELPSMEPQGPGDLWTCGFEGCHKRVHQGSTEEGKATIKEHFDFHLVNGGNGTDAREKIDLVLDESRPYLPVSNLVRKLQSFVTDSATTDNAAEKNDEGKESVSENILRKNRAPIRRRY